VSKSSLHRLAILLAVAGTSLFITGPAVSSNDARPLYSLGQTHIWLGGVVFVLTAVIAFALWRTKAEPRVQRLGWIALALNIVEGLLGLVPDPQAAPVRVAHSLLGQIFFSLIFALVIFTAQSEQRIGASAQNAGLLRFVAIATPALVLSQVALGVVFRHGVTGVLPHILWAFVVAMFLVLVIAAVVSAGNPEIRKAGIAFTVIAGVQILLGFALFIMQSVDIDPIYLIVVTAVHATTAALTLATAVLLTIVIRRAISSAAAAPVGNMVTARRN